MATLNIALQEGFDGDLVLIKVNDLEVFRKDDVKTKRLLDLAEEFERQVPDGPVKLEVLLPKRNLHGKTEVQALQKIYVGISVSVSGPSIDFIISQKPFGYA